jgi:hypothetical protein
MKRRVQMKKVFVITAAFMLIMTTWVYAGGDKVCGDKATGPAGDTGSGTVEQNQPPAD